MSIFSTISVLWGLNFLARFYMSVSPPCLITCSEMSRLNWGEWEKELIFFSEGPTV